jgi:hypothetical protein
MKPIETWFNEKASAEMEKVIKERPILFSAPMVRAILDGTKTMTRRVVKPQPISLAGSPVFVDKNHPTSPPCSFVNDVSYLCPYGVPGDRLWVREAFYHGPVIVDTLRDRKEEVRTIYRADPPGHNCKKWKPSIHMFRKYSRILLEVTAVRVERLQDISRADAKDEGFLPSAGDGLEHWKGRKFGNANEAFKACWCDINGPDSWNANPWVWVVEFKRITEGRKP